MQALGHSYDVLAQATTKANDRNANRSRHFLAVAQGQALSFVQQASSEATAINSEAQEFVEQLARANQQTAAAALELSRSWTGLNPFAELILNAFPASAQPAATGADQPSPTGSSPSTTTPEATAQATAAAAPAPPAAPAPTTAAEATRETPPKAAVEPSPKAPAPSPSAPRSERGSSRA
jgi:hypothetical protein